MHFSPLRRFLSYFHPQKIAGYTSEENNALELFLFKNQVLLCSDKAIYSDGNNYAPFRIAFKEIFASNKAERINSFLLLGGGLCSASQILHRYQPKAQHTVVEYDAEIIKIARTVLEATLVQQLNFVHDHAANFVEHCTQTFDCIGIDLFKDIKIPPPFLEKKFVENLLPLSHASTYFIFNWLNTDEVLQSEAYQCLPELFGFIDYIEYNKNLIVIAKLSNESPE